MKIEQIISEILNDSRFLDAMRLIDEPAKSGRKVEASFNSLHGIAHAKHVMNYAVKFLRDMNASEHDIALVKISALLHDIALSGHDKENHAERSADLAREWLRDYDLAKADVNTICHAIAVHSNGDDANNLIDVALLLGDKMDLTGDRLNLSRLHRNYDPLTWALIYVNNVEFIITDKTATLKHDAEVGFDVKLLNGWPKAITVPAKVAKFIGREFFYEVHGKKYNEQEARELVK